MRQERIRREGRAGSEAGKPVVVSMSSVAAWAVTGVDGGRRGAGQRYYHHRPDRHLRHVPDLSEPFGRLAGGRRRRRVTLAGAFDPRRPMAPEVSQAATGAG